jgi:hypothetical protein
MSVNERQIFANALQGKMIGGQGPTELDEDVLDPLKKVLEAELGKFFP